jgi:hypothetical protein
MVNQNNNIATEIGITQADISTVFGENHIDITNLKLQLAALKRTVIGLQQEALSCQCKEEQESSSDKE